MYLLYANVMQYYIVKLLWLTPCLSWPLPWTCALLTFPDLLFTRGHVHYFVSPVIALPLLPYRFSRLSQDTNMLQINPSVHTVLGSNALQK